MSNRNSRTKNQNLNSKIKISAIFGFLLALLPFTFYLLLSQQSSAQTTNTISVSPQLIQLDLSEDAPEAEYTYTNNTSQTVELTLSMQDVKELEDRGIPGILDTSESGNYAYGLASWATFSNNNLIIPPGEQKTVTVYLDKTRLTLGGHYATVLAEIKQQDEQKTVKLRAILSSLLFVRSGSEYEREDAVINEINPIRQLLGIPEEFAFRLQNVGNVDVTPYGILTVTDPLGNEIGKGIVNENSLITLPESIRRYTVPVKISKKMLIPGLYKAKLSIRFGKKEIRREKEVVFFSLGGINRYGIAAGVLLLGVFIASHRLRKKRSS